MALTDEMNVTSESFLDFFNFFTNMYLMNCYIRYVMYTNEPVIFLFKFKLLRAVIFSHSNSGPD